MKKWFSNIWIRNTIFFVFILFLARITNDRGSFSDFNFERFKIYLSYGIDYAFILVHNKVLIEQFFLRKRIKLYILFLLCSYLAYLPFYFFFNSPYDPEVGAILTAVMSLTAVKLLGLGLYFIVRYVVDRERFYKASINAKELEMEILKGQLNPHFLFNALNNIYSYLITENNNGQELILRLSELMRYILDSNKKEQVTLGEELRFIENYMAFEKERLGNRCEIIYTRNIESEKIKIAPLILFTFIENAFKHGTLSIQKSVIELTISCKGTVLEMKVTNPVSTIEMDSTRMGLKNAIRRLELLYPDKHKLLLERNEEKFKVSCQLFDVK